MTPGQVLTLYVGGRGTAPTPSGSQQPGGGGYNGGGDGGQDGIGAAGGGGGASDIRTGAATLADRLLVAGGGGGNHTSGAEASTGGPGGAPAGGDDGRYKRDVTEVCGALASVLKLRGVTYYWKQAEFPEKKFEARRQLGFIAQEIEPYYPELVTTDPDGYKSVDYARLTPVLVEALKEQQQQIEALQQQAATAKAENAALKAAAAADKTQTTATLESLAQRLRALEAGGGQASK